MLRLYALFLHALLGLPAVLAAQESSSSSLAVHPTCAQNCILGAFEAELCAPSDHTCICTDQTFQYNVSSCVAATCSIPEALTAQNDSLTTCGAPVRDRSGQLVAVNSAMACTAAFFVVLRIAYKLFVIKLDVGLDDWFILATMLTATPSAFITAYGTTANGLGRDIWTLTAEQITHVLRYFYIIAILYFLEAALVKLSIICFYMRIFPAQRTRRLLWATFIFTVLWGIAFIFAAIFQCQPVSYFWTKWDGLHEGSCVDANAIAWSHAAMNIALDLWTLAIPLWELRKLQLHWKKKVGVALMFGVGVFVTVMSTLRLQSLISFATTSNVTWEFFDVTLWSTIEIPVAIICACLPMARLLLVKIFPILSGSTRRRDGSYYRTYGADGLSGTSAARNVSSRVVTVDRPSTGTSGEEQAGIGMTKSFTVQYSDGDEIGLVDMRDGTPDKAS